MSKRQKKKVYGSVSAIKRRASLDNKDFGELTVDSILDATAKSFAESVNASDSIERAI